MRHHGLVESIAHRMTSAAGVFIALAALQKGSAFLLLPFITEVVGPEEYGAISIVTVAGILWGTFVGSFLEAGVFRDTARSELDSGAKSSLRFAGLYLRLGAPMLSALLALTFYFGRVTWFNVPPLAWAIAITAAGLLAFVSSYALPVVRAGFEIKKYAAITLILVMMSLALKIVLVIGLDEGIVGWVMADAIAAITAYVAAIILVPVPKADLDRRTAKRVLKFGLPLVPHQVSFWLLTSASRPILGLVSTLREVGLLAVGGIVASVANIVLSEVNRAVLNQYSVGAEVPESLRKIKQLQIVLAILLPAGVAAGAALFGPIAFAKEYVGFLPSMGLLLAAQVAYGMYLIPANQLVQTAGKPRTTWIASLVGAFVVTLGTLVLGSIWGSLGAGLATLLGFTAMLFTILLVAKRERIRVEWGGSKPPAAVTLCSIAALALSLASLFTPESSSLAYGLAATGLMANSTSLFLLWRLMYSTKIGRSRAK